MATGLVLTLLGVTIQPPPQMYPPPRVQGAKKNYMELNEA